MRQRHLSRPHLYFRRFKVVDLVCVGGMQDLREQRLKTPGENQTSKSMGASLCSIPYVLHSLLKHKKSTPFRADSVTRRACGLVTGKCNLGSSLALLKSEA